MTITALLHGDEDAGLLVAYDLMRQEGVTWRATGPVTVVPLANPAAALVRSRTSGYDRLDANRVGGGNPAGQLTERVVAELMAVAAGSQLVVNLHAFETGTEVSGVFVDPQEPGVRTATLRALAAAGLGYVLAIPAPVAYPSIDAALCEAGVPAITIELPRTDLLAPRQRAAAVAGLIRVLAEHGVAEVLPGAAAAEAPVTAPPCYARTTVRASAMGVLRPERRLFDRLAAGQRVGTIAYLPELAEVEVCVPRPDVASGAERWDLIQVRPEEVVRPNDILFGVGGLDHKLMREFEDAL